MTFIDITKWSKGFHSYKKMDTIDFFQFGLCPPNFEEELKHLTETNIE